MKLIELLNICNDCLNIDVISNETAEVLSTYDGKNSIDEKYNDYVVVSVSVSINGNLMIYIND